MFDLILTGVIYVLAFLSAFWIVTYALPQIYMSIRPGIDHLCNMSSRTIALPVHRVIGARTYSIFCSPRLEEEIRCGLGSCHGFWEWDRKVDMLQTCKSGFERGVSLD